jgi:hypothetical protein
MATSVSFKGEPTDQNCQMKFLLTLLAGILYSLPARIVQAKYAVKEERKMTTNAQNQPLEERREAEDSHHSCVTVQFLQSEAGHCTRHRESLIIPGNATKNDSANVVLIMQGQQHPNQTLGDH